MLEICSGVISVVAEIVFTLLSLKFPKELLSNRNFEEIHVI